MWQQHQGLLDQQIVEHHRFSDEFSLNFKCSQLHLTRRDVNVPLMEPQHSCEVYVMNLPRDVLMRELHDFMATCGEIYEIRLLLEFSGFCKGKCFIRYCRKLSARKAVLVLNSTEIRPGDRVMVRMSYNNSKLMMMNIPKDVTMELLLSEVKTGMGRGLVGIELGGVDKVNSIHQCALLSYEHHEHALEARRACKGGLHLWNSPIKVEWAEPGNTFVQNSVMYFKNFPEEMTRWDFFDFLIDAIDIETAIRMDVKQGRGYVVFHSEPDREHAYLRLTNRTFQGKKLDLRFKPNVSSTDSCRTVQSLDHIPQKHSGDSSKLQSSISIPSFSTAAQHTAPLLSQELDAIIRSVFTFLHQHFPSNSWRLYDPIKELVVPTGLVIRLFVPVNNIKYDFLLAAQ